MFFGGIDVVFYLVKRVKSGPGKEPEARSTPIEWWSSGSP